MSKFKGICGRRALLSGLATAALLAMSGAAPARDVSGELVILQWQGGTELEMWHEVEAKFIELNLGVTVREFQPAGGQGDPRAGIRTVLLGGEVVDIIINTGRHSASSSTMPAFCALSRSSGRALAGTKSSANLGRISAPSMACPMA
ncbi:hypothetical protein N8D56_20370 [Devosia sp. A8/3-2]|nr:hypothetical protein N8D56_20370 [Devosia sp. A8/3-2]